VGDDGEIVPHDHPDLEGNALMLRGVADHHIVKDENYGCRRLSSALFKNDPRRQGYLSFNSQSCIETRNDDPGTYMTRRGWLGVVNMSVAHFRTYDPAPQSPQSWKIGMLPLNEETPPDPCHAAVWGKINDSRANQIRRNVEWTVEIPNVVLDETQSQAE
jgi:hypothetical protein